MNGLSREVLRNVDDEATRLAKTLLRSARHGALATLSPDDGAPQASRVGLATALDGTPLILVSRLALHTAAIQADPRCSLLVGDIGKGDPLAHARATLACRAQPLDRVAHDGTEARRRFLAAHPKAELYIDLGDFSFFRLEMIGGRLNGGFGRAYDLTSAALTSRVIEGFSAAEPDAVEWINRSLPGDIRATGLDSEGIDIVSKGKPARLWFDAPISQLSELPEQLERLTKVSPFTSV